MFLPDASILNNHTTFRASPGMRCITGVLVQLKAVLVMPTMKKCITKSKYIISSKTLAFTHLTFLNTFHIKKRAA